MYRGYIHAVPIPILNLRKYKLLKKANVTVDDWLFLANEYARADSQKNIDYCMRQAKQLEQKQKPAALQS
jgi:hypothetical protein